MIFEEPNNGMLYALIEEYFAKLKFKSEDILESSLIRKSIYLFFERIWSIRGRVTIIEKRKRRELKMGRTDYENWLKEAEWDLETAKILNKQKHYNAAAFYAQQAAEKLLKTALLYKNESAWGHSVRELVIRWGKCSEIDISELL